MTNHLKNGHVTLTTAKRGVVSPVIYISKVFEYCILYKFQSYFSSCHEQFGFKKGHMVVVVQSTLYVKLLTI